MYVYLFGVEIKYSCMRVAIRQNILNCSDAAAAAAL